MPAKLTICRIFTLLADTELAGVHIRRRFIPKPYTLPDGNAQSIMSIMTINKLIVKFNIKIRLLTPRIHHRMGLYVKNGRNAGETQVCLARFNKTENLK